MERFSLKTRVFFGAQPLAALEELGEKRVFIVTDGFLAQSGLLDRVKARLRGESAVFDQVTPDPSLELVARGVAALQSAGAQAILAFGGGSPMDCAKAIRHFSGERLPLWCVPTTAGTGSEVTSFAILTDTQRGVKHALVDDALLPDAAILAPEFLAGVPAAVTADTGMDVLTHAAEAYVARGANSFTDALAEAAFTAAFFTADNSQHGIVNPKGQSALAVHNHQVHLRGSFKRKLATILRPFFSGSFNSSCYINIAFLGINGVTSIIGHVNNRIAQTDFCATLSPN